MSDPAGAAAPAGRRAAVEEHLAGIAAQHNLNLRIERIECRMRSAAVDWWGSRGEEALEGRVDLDLDAEGRIGGQRAMRMSPTERPFAGLRLEVEPPLARIVLDRDEKRNAVSLPMLAAMTAFLHEIAANPEVRALVLAGEGRGFCAGEDVGGFEFPDLDTAERFLSGPLSLFTALERLPMPVVVAVHGFGLGFGSEVLLVADSVHAEPGTVLGFAEIDHGFVPSVLVTRGLGVSFRRRVLDLALTGRRIGTDEALEARLVHEVADDARAAAEAAASEMAGWSPESVALVKGLLGSGAVDDHAHAREFMPAVLTKAGVTT